MSEQPPLAPDELVAAGGEREILAAFLDWHRSVILNKASGLTDAQVRRNIVPSATTLAGVVEHLTGVERYWFLRVLDQQPAKTLPPNSRGDDASWDLEPGDTVAVLLAEYRAACQQCRDAAARLPLDHLVPHPRLGRVSLRWIYVHMIEETARHAGHMDILRELTDGATGVDG